MKNTIAEMQNQLDVMTMRMSKAEEQISDIEDKIMENNEAEKKRERKLLDHEYRCREFSDSTKHNNIHIIGAPEEEQEKGTEGIFEQIMAENFPNSEKETDIKSKRHRELPSKSTKIGQCQNVS